MAMQHPTGPRRPGSLRVASAPLLRDPVCGMMVPGDAPLRAEFGGQTYVFCAPRCRQRFVADPRAFLEGAGPASAASAEWTCPMHPEIVRPGPGECPICGMALEPRMISEVEEVSPELRDMQRRFWVGWR
jgi:Cu+-exporting ATPase